MFLFFVLLNAYFRLFLLLINTNNIWHWRLVLQGFLNDVVAAGFFYFILVFLWIPVRSIRSRQLVFALFTLCWILINIVNYEYAFTFNRLVPLAFFVEFQNIDSVGSIWSVFADYLNVSNVLNGIPPIILTLFITLKAPRRLFRPKLGWRAIVIFLICAAAQSATLTPAIQPVFHSLIHGHILKFWYYDYDEKSANIQDSNDLETFSEDFKRVILAEETESGFSLPVIKGDKPNVVFIFMESFRAFEMGVFGSELGITSNFDRYAKQGILFKNIFSSGMLTRDGQWASLCGSQLGRAGSAFRTQKDHAAKCLSDFLAEEGYDTWWFHNQSATYDEQGYFMKRHRMKHIKDRLTFPMDAEVLGWGISDMALMKHALRHRQTSREPFYWNLLTITNHSPYIAPEEFQTKTQYSEALNKFYNTYHYSDHCLGFFLDRFLETDEGRNSLIVITADHGVSKELSDTNSRDEYHLLLRYRIPLLILYPEHLGVTPKEINTLGGQTDILPTLLDILNIRTDSPMMGRSLIRSYPHRFAKITTEEHAMVTEDLIYRSYPSVQALDWSGEESDPSTGIDWFELSSEIDDVQSWMIRQTDYAAYKEELKENGWKR